MFGPCEDIMKYTKKQIKENRKEWVKALRSGKYEQGTGKLINQGAYCCLGVACEIQGLPKYGGKGFLDPSCSREEFDIIEFDIDLPDLAMEALGFCSRDPMLFVPEEGGHYSLADLNDDLKYTFEQIADLIEAQADDWDGLGEC